MLAEDFVENLERADIKFYAGVPDSLLLPFISVINSKYVFNKNHIVTANEGLAVGIAAGYYLSNQKIACVYLQNSGLGNVFNPICSLTHRKVYGIPVLYIVGWRGEPGIKDEPQHIFQGEITLKTLELLEISYEIVDENMGAEELTYILSRFSKKWSSGKSTALVIKKDALVCKEKFKYTNPYLMKRERAIEIIVDELPQDVLFVSSTGKISRELYEIRENKKCFHNSDFLTVGSMGHCSSIALSIALNHPERKIVCLDGDGALFMHMGGMTTIGSTNPKNLIHILLDNGAHETVGGIPTSSFSVDICKIAEACGYSRIYEIEDSDSLSKILGDIYLIDELIFIRIKLALGARKELGRPKENPKENMEKIIYNLQGEYK